MPVEHLDDLLTKELQAIKKENDRLTSINKDLKTQIEKLKLKNLEYKNLLVENGLL